MCNQCFKLIRMQFSSNEPIQRDSLFLTMQTLKCPAMRALEDLTPSGSEFVEEPERCFKHVKAEIQLFHGLAIDKQVIINGLTEIIRRTVKPKDDEIVYRLCGFCSFPYRGMANTPCGRCGRAQ